MTNRFIFFRYFLLSSIVFSGIFGCKQGNGKLPALAAVTDNGKMASSAPKDRLFHYWDNFNFEDTVAVKNPDIGEQALVDFIAVFPKVSDSIRSQAIRHMLSKAKRYPTSFSYFMQQYDRYLYDPNSPMRNDSYYEPVLEFLVDSCRLNDTDKYRYDALLKLVRKNKVGTKAPDFEFQLPQGNENRLYGVNAPFTLLFFYDPGCLHCEAAMDQLRNTASFQQLVKKGELAVLAIYALGGGRNIWKAYQSHIPASWTNGLDRHMQILSKGLYEIKASPTIYLLDKDKTVVLKDSDLSKVAMFFNIKMTG